MEFPDPSSGWDWSRRSWLFFSNLRHRMDGLDGRHF
ncbi:MAG: hypothetical protein QOH78_2210, partial [Verrucomicrobiota bacterium]